MLAIVLPLVATLVGVLSLYIAYRSFRHSTGKDIAESRKQEIIEAIRTQLSPVDTKQVQLGSQLEQLTNRAVQLETQLGKLTDRQGNVLDRLSILETKIEVFWRTVAMDAAKIIHSPDPRRSRVDYLLEQFTEGTLTTAEELELRKILVTIRDYEPGAPSVFPIHPGEQVAAAILLRTMEYVIGDTKLCLTTLANQAT